MSGGRQHFRIKDNLSVRWSIEDGVSGEGIVLDMSTKGRSACRGLNHHKKALSQTWALEKSIYFFPVGVKIS